MHATGKPSELNLGKKFGQIADAYDCFRPDYPREIFSRILGAVTPPRQRLVDLGLGRARWREGSLPSLTGSLAWNQTQPWPRSCGNLSLAFKCELQRLKKLCFWLRASIW